MRKLLHLILILTVSLIPLGVYFVSAHPLDVSNTTLTIYPRTIEGVTYLHPAELDRILVLSGGIDPARISVALYYAMTGTLTKYLEETMIVENDGEVCHMGNFGILDGLMVDEIFRNGFPISYTVSCSSNIETPLITINIC